MKGFQRLKSLEENPWNFVTKFCHTNVRQCQNFEKKTRETQTWRLSTFKTFKKFGEKTRQIQYWSNHNVKNRSRHYFNDWSSIFFMPYTLCCKCLGSFLFLWCKMPMFWRAGMREGGKPLPLAFQYLLLWYKGLVIWIW